MTLDLQDYTEADFCYLTTTGRVSGRPHTIEIWFALRGQTLYILSGGREKSDWVKNALKQPQVHVKINDRVFAGQARLVEDKEEDAQARTLVRDKYTPRSNDELEDWARTSLPIAIDLA